MQRETTVTKEKDINREWYIVDAENKTLGRLITEISKVLTGKNKTIYSPNLDCGDFVIVVNAQKVKLSGDKENNKFYYNHSKYLGGLRKRSAKTMIEKYPREMFERAVWGMLPKGKLGRKIHKKLFVYAEATHPHSAQKPKVLEINA